jgi:hypothetical protein
MDALSALTETKPQTPEALPKYIASLGLSQAPWWAMRAVMESIGNAA